MHVPPLPLHMLTPPPVSAPLAASSMNQSDADVRAERTRALARAFEEQSQQIAHESDVLLFQQQREEEERELELLQRLASKYGKPPLIPASQGTGASEPYRKKKTPAVDDDAYVASFHTLPAKTHQGRTAAVTPALKAQQVYALASAMLWWDDFLRHAHTARAPACILCLMLNRPHKSHPSSSVANPKKSVVVVAY